MTKEEFKFIWTKMSYDRIARHGTTVNPPPEIQGLPRGVFGQNGQGRFATFCFSSEFMISSVKDGQRFTCRVYRTPENPLNIDEVEFIGDGINKHGTEIKSIGNYNKISYNEDKIRESIGSRFLVDPSFEVYLNNIKISFSDISSSSLQCYDLDIDKLGKVKIIHIDTLKADKTTKQHGIAWWVLNRAVGECKWRGTDYERILDGRTSEAKRYTFIVQADFLSEAKAIKEDWSWFKEDNEVWQEINPKVQDKIKEIINEKNKLDQNLKRQSVIEKVGCSINKLPLMSKERIEAFITGVVENCPNFREKEIVQLSSILAKLEKANSGYGLLEILHNQNINDIDALHAVLKDWTVSMAKIVLDEIQNRLKLIEELKAKIQVDKIDEVQELQPLFAKGLWMFGPQFESIEFTSNRGMTTVIRKIF